MAGPAHPAAAFTTGSIFRHVTVMTATGSVGLIALFIVDFLNLFYIAQLGEKELAAAIGYAGTLMFFLISTGIGTSIAGSALVARALGAGRRDDARRLAASSLVFTVLVMTALAVVLTPALGPVVAWLGATGRTHEIAVHFLTIVVPSTPLMGLGMCASGLLRATGDAKRAMYVTLSAGIATAAFDPLLIFGFCWGVTGAAVATVLARLVMLGAGWYGVVVVHDLVARPDLAGFRRDWRPLAGIAGPAVLTNIATPVANAWVTFSIAPFGDAAVAGWAVIGRLVPLAFGAVFALSGAVGPIFGQNLGARRFDRVRSTVTASLQFCVAYCTVAWAALFLLADPIVAIFAMTGEGAELVIFFCRVVAGTFVFTAGLFVAAAAFNNIGHPTLSTAFNWGRATLGTLPFAYAGATIAGAPGVIAGQGIGSVLFGIAAVLVCYRVVDRLGTRPEG